MRAEFWKKSLQTSVKGVLCPGITKCKDLEVENSLSSKYKKKVNEVWDDGTQGNVT